MIAGFLQGVDDDHLFRKLHGPEAILQTMYALMQTAKVYVKQEK
jgi:hypothetical protein